MGDKEAVNTITFIYPGVSASPTRRTDLIGFARQELLAQPLEMKNSHFTPINTDGGHAPMLGGGLCTTLNDYIHFLSMIYHEGTYEGKRILTAETVKEMQANQVKDALVSPGEYIAIIVCFIIFGLFYILTT